jgi:hypothetical protein
MHPLQAKEIAAGGRVVGVTSRSLGDLGRDDVGHSLFQFAIFRFVVCGGEPYCFVTSSWPRGFDGVNTIACSVVQLALVFDADAIVQGDEMVCNEKH